MEPAALLAASRRQIGQVRWLGAPERAWVCCGVGEDFRAALAEQLIRAHLPDGPLHLIGRRPESRTITRDLAVSAIHERLPSGALLLWCPSFERVIELSPIGVLRLGVHRQIGERARP